MAGSRVQSSIELIRKQGLQGQCTARGNFVRRALALTRRTQLGGHIAARGRYKVVRDLLEWFGAGRGARGRTCVEPRGYRVGRYIRALNSRVGGDVQRFVSGMWMVQWSMGMLKLIQAFESFESVP